MTEQVCNDALLVVIDHVERNRLTHLLHEMGRSVAGTSSFREARQLLEHAPPRILISEIRLGDFNGLHLAILAMQARVAGVILLDDDFDALLEVQALQYLSLYLVKPVHATEFSGHVAHILQANEPAG